MKKTSLFFLGSLLLFTFFVAQQLKAQSTAPATLAPVTATYTYAYKYNELSASYNWDNLLQSPVMITWTAESLPNAAADGSPQYQVTLIMSSST